MNASVMVVRGREWGQWERDLEAAREAVAEAEGKWTEAFERRREAMGRLDRVLRRKPAAEEPPAKEMPGKLLDTEEAASVLGVRPQTLRKWRALGGVGPLYIRQGKNCIRYRPEDLEAYLQENKNRLGVV